MFINILSFLKALDIQVTKLEVKHQGVFFSREPTVPTVNRIIVHFYDNRRAADVASGLEKPLLAG